ncbi:cytochrome P450 [Kibdelosporangium philippinense]|uniref:Cytochrome P450 n=1 Tax=Kibdelosporangium philippinense TaxID=211113 RepID=A0ABS8ZJV0_9PSEU|nr:cytochrome P450 [Kibdelosporangium philippinense]MCE7008015.1 cytochrome P450 [Kibdelosporangium philippinense]
MQGLPLTRSADRPFDPPAELRGQEALARMVYPNGHEGWLATSRAAARAVLADPRFSARYELLAMPTPGMAGDGPLPAAEPGDFSGLDAPDHTRYRRLLTGQFTVHRMRQLTERIERTTAEHLDAMQREGPPVDLVRAFAQPIPAVTICEMLGVPYQDRAKFQDQAILVTGVDAAPEEFAAAMGDLKEYLGELVAAKRADPSDDILSGLTETDLDDAELTTIGLFLLGAGIGTTAHMLTLGTLAMLRTPMLFGTARDPLRIDETVEELLRYLSTVPFAVRAALEDVTVCGQLVKKGDVVTVSLQAANRDDGHFDDPDVLAPGRRTAGHVAFGHGIHQCLGQQLARVELRVALRALADRFPSLRLAVPFEDVPGLTDGLTFNPTSLPVAW